MPTAAAAAAAPSVVLATAGYDHTIRFWEATTGRCYRTLQYAESQVNKVEITGDKQYLAAAGNPHIRLFEVNSNQPQPVQSYEGHKSNVTAIGFESDGQWMYSGSEDGTVKIWDLRAPLCQREYESRAAVNTVVLHPNQTELISGDQNGNIRVWDLTANTCSCELVPEMDTAIRSLSVSYDGSLLVAANSKGTCFIWRHLTRPANNSASGGLSSVAAGANSSSSSSSSGMAPAGSATHFEPLQRLQAHDTYILKCLLSPEFAEPNRCLATASSDHTVKIWNLDGFTLERTLTGHTRWVWDCVFSVDGAYLVTASSDTTARLWELASGETIRMYQGHQKATVCCALNDATDMSGGGNPAGG